MVFGGFFWGSFLWFLILVLVPSLLKEKERRAVKKRKPRGTKEKEEAPLICFFF